MAPDRLSLPLGAARLPDGKTRFRLWAPRCGLVEIVPEDRERPASPMERDSLGFHTITLDGFTVGDGYRYRLDGSKLRPDPVSRHLPAGLHGPTAIVDPSAFQWQDEGWQAPSLGEMVIYELHIGCFTPQGTFDAAIGKLDYLMELGINCIELMPVAQFPGRRNWGYDGASLFAVQHSYGGPEGLRRFVAACHARGLAVCLDVVYNHLGPEGNYLGDFCPWFTDRYRTPWGPAVNFDGPDSDPVRETVIANACYWIEEYHLDALRLDAVEFVRDFSPSHLLAELRERVAATAARLGRQAVVIAESDLNDVRLLHPRERGGYALDGQWSDDFHHAVHALLSGERNGYYRDFGEPSTLAKALRQSFVFDGRRSLFRRRRHGSDPSGIAPWRFVHCLMNHDQVGNRAQGDRLTANIPPEAHRAAAFLLLLAPFTPLLFMGQEYGETAPFLYFVEHGDPELVEAVRRGRREEFAAFGWAGVPDPQDLKTFEASRLDWALLEQEAHASILAGYRAWIALRRTLVGEGLLHRERHIVWEATRGTGFALLYPAARGCGVLVAANLGEREAHFRIPGLSATSKLGDAAGLPGDCPDTTASGGRLVLPPWGAAAWRCLREKG